ESRVPTLSLEFEVSDTKLVSINTPFLTRNFSLFGPSSSAVLSPSWQRGGHPLPRTITQRFTNPKRHTGVPVPEDPLCFSDGDVAWLISSSASFIDAW